MLAGASALADAGVLFAGAFDCVFVVDWHDTDKRTSALIRIQDMRSLLLITHLPPTIWPSVIASCVLPSLALAWATACSVEARVGTNCQSSMRTDFRMSCRPARSRHQRAPPELIDRETQSLHRLEPGLSGGACRCAPSVHTPPRLSR